MSQSTVVRVENATKIIKGNTLLDGIRLEVQAGETMGITGHNGSGKSMLLRAITGLIRLTSGDITVFEQRIGQEVDFAPDTGAMIDIPGFLPNYSGFRNLQLLAMIRRLISDNEIRQTLEQVGLDPHNKKPFRTYSTGMRQRLGIAQAIMERPRLVILDEPTRGIDVDGHEQVYQLMRGLKQRGVTLILASHYANELSDLCDRVVVMNKGQLRPLEIPNAISTPVFG